ncbi:MAG: HNH endonuclease [Paludibacteraceae bacterium]|nr:HNH endonuclease [Paludibacteraceae bacterium]
MDYKTIYYDIIEKAKDEVKCGKRIVGYFETHHIVPKSFGGGNNKENLVKLTAREHFICHWLLVKMCPKGTIERNKMLFALWRMRESGSMHHRYVNSRVYEKLRVEFSNAIGDVMKIKQKGEKNSQFGKKWYTNRDTGESKPFKTPPSEKWVLGRNKFKGEYCVCRNLTANYIKKKNDVRDRTLIAWNEFVKSGYKSIHKFNVDRYPSINLHKWFREYIPEYKEHKKNLTTFEKNY